MTLRSLYSLWLLGKFMEQKLWDEEKIGLVLVSWPGNSFSEMLMVGGLLWQKEVQTHLRQ